MLTLGEPVVVYTNRKSSTFSHTITFKNAATGATLKQFTDVTDNVTWTPTSGEITSMENSIPNSNTLSVRVEQYNNQVGQSSSVTVPFNIANANPIFTDFTYKDSNATVVAITGSDQVLVKGQSILETTISSANKMQAIKGASPTQYTISFDGTTLQQPYQSSGDVVGTITQVPSIGQRTILVTATDSRTNNTSVAKQAVVYDYAAPTLESTLQRENNFGSDTTIHLQGTWFPLNIGGVDRNSLTNGSMRYRYREDTGSFGGWLSRGFTVTDNTWQVTTDFVVSLDNTKKYVFEFQISDRFGTTTTTNSVDVGKPIVFIGEKDGTPALGIGKMPTDGALDVVGDIYSNGLQVPSGSWTEIARSVGNFTPTGTSFTFPSYKYIKVSVFSRQVSPPSSTQYVLRAQFNGLTSSTGYGRVLQRITSAGTLAYSVDNTNSIIVGVSRAPGQQSLAEVTLNGNIGGISSTIAHWNLSTEDLDWLACYGRYMVQSADPLTSIRIYAETVSYDAEVIVYGHN